MWFCIYCMINDKNLLERKERWTLNWEQGLGNPGWILIQNFTTLTFSIIMIWHQARLISYFLVFNILSTIQGLCGPHFSGILKKTEHFELPSVFTQRTIQVVMNALPLCSLLDLGISRKPLYNAESQLLSTLSPLLSVQPLLQY